MGHDQLRDDKECQNCGYTVEEIYCPHCGQKNIETRQSFAHLIGHFAEDFTHYDGAFWKTIKYLLFKPAFLTKEYLMGKRQMYVPPVKLYIFISFLAFLIPALIPDMGTEDAGIVSVENVVEEPQQKVIRLDKKEDVWFNFGFNSETGIENPMSYKTVKEMDSIEKLKPEHLRLSALEYKLGKKVIKLYEHNTSTEIKEKLFTNLAHNIPKVIFLYMPVFAFWLWIFHSKKRWYFFDHGIFTLHYFSFLLLNFAIVVILFSLITAINIAYENKILSSISGISVLLLFLLYLIWQIYYFYRAHRKMYYENFFINFIKSSAMFAINMISMISLFIALFYIMLYNLH